VAAAIASWPFFSQGGFVAHWLRAWALSWIMMLPIVIFAAPGIRRLVSSLTRE
jgi:hypothetical protein